MNQFIKITFLLTAAIAGGITGNTFADDGGKLRVFILAGQSNMEGKAKNSLLESQAVDPKTEDLFKHLRKDGKWIEREDVGIKYLSRHGQLTIGYGSRDRTGVELEFGHVVGDHFEEPVLLIKTAWGGHSLVQKFRSPSAGMPSQEVLEKELAQARQRVERNNEKRNRNDPLPTMDDIKKPYGSSYRMMLDEVRTTLKDLDSLFPQWKGRQPELTGFVWFQGWNDQYGGAEQQYADNIRHFIQDIRRDLSAPDLPVVIGVMGQNGSKPAKGAMLVIQEAQLSMEAVPEFQGNVKAVKTDELVDRAAEELYPHWRERFEEWEKTGSDFAYHYMGSAIWFNRIGRAMGESMLSMIGE